jgi:hypothetical protein
VQRGLTWSVPVWEATALELEARCKVCGSHLCTRRSRMRCQSRPWPHDEHRHIASGEKTHVKIMQLNRRVTPIDVPNERVVLASETVDDEGCELGVPKRPDDGGQRVSQ